LDSINIITPHISSSSKIRHIRLPTTISTTISSIPINLHPTSIRIHLRLRPSHCSINFILIHLVLLLLLTIGLVCLNLVPKSSVILLNVGWWDAERLVGVVSSGREGLVVCGELAGGGDADWGLGVSLVLVIVVIIRSEL